MKAIVFSISKKLFGSDENPSFRKEFLVTDKMFRVYALDYVKFAKDEPFSFRQIPTYLGLMVPIFHCFFAITAICYDFNDFDGLMNALIGTAAAFNGMVKVLTIFSNAKMFSKFRQTLIEQTEGAKQGFEKNLLQQYLRTISITTKLLIVSYVGAFFVFISVPLLMARYLKNIEWPLPLNIKILGIDTKSYPGYAIHYMFCFCSIFNGALVIGASDLVFLYLSSYAMFKLDVCAHFCERIGEEKSEYTQKESLVKCIKLYTEISEFIKQVSKAFKLVILAQGFSSLADLTATIFYAKLSPINSSYVFLLAALMQLGGYCYCGQIVINKSFDVNKAVYTSSWYKILNQEHHRYLITFILSTQQRNGFIVEGLFDFSFVSLNSVIICSKDLFVNSFRLKDLPFHFPQQILKACMSYLAFLQNVTG